MENKYNHILILISACATIITTLTAIVGVYFGLQTLQETAKANQGNLILNLNRDFFFNDRLYQVRQAIENDKPLFTENHGAFLVQDIDDYLGMFEMMDQLLERNIFDQHLFKQNFCDYVADSYKNEEIKQYVAYVRTEYNNQKIYAGFEHLATKTCK